LTEPPPNHEPDVAASGQPATGTGGPGTDAHEGRGRGGARRFLVAGVALAVLALVVAGLTIRLPRYILSPGMSRATETLISVEGAPTYDDAGSVDFLTVSMRQASPLELVASWFNPDLEVRTREELFGDQSDSENREVNLQLMANSKDSAEYQALSRLGYDIASNGTGAVITTVAEGSPAWCELHAGDVVTAIDGEVIDLSNELVEMIAQSAPGSSVTMQVEPYAPDMHRELSDAERAGCPALDPALDLDVPHSVVITLGSRSDDPQRAYLGVSTFTRDLTFDFPIGIEIDSGSVGGPSAGLAFTLGILDVLTPGSLTGGLQIATTGTMSLDGVVGPIGGIHQKVIAARRRGVELMLVPTSEIDEARRYAGDLRVEPVGTLDDALALLATLGGGDAVLPPRTAAVAAN